MVIRETVNTLRSFSTGFIHNFKASLPLDTYDSLQPVINEEQQFLQWTIIIFNYPHPNTDEKYSDRLPPVLSSGHWSNTQVPLCSAVFQSPGHYWITAADWRHNGESIADQQCRGLNCWAIMTFAIPGWYLGLDGYNQGDACRISIAQPAGDRPHQFNCSTPWLRLTVALSF